MKKVTITSSMLDREENAEAITNIEKHLGRNLIAGEELDLDGGKLCNGKECGDGEICIFGNCVKDDVPQ